MISRTRSLRAFVFGPSAAGESTAAGTLWRNIALVTGLAALTWIGAYIRIPLEPVPITLQTLFVLLAGALAGPWRGSLSQGVYVAAGAAGVPVLAGAAGGLANLAGPTGGYLVGFAIAPLLVGRLIRLRTGFRWSLLVFAMGSLVILVLGVLHLAVFFTRDLWGAVQLGFLPFLAGDAAKTFAAASIFGSFVRLRSARSAT